jgi:catechol 2,3-dioxygenase-like lactoylglutathione lyase family enzyme
MRQWIFAALLLSGCATVQAETPTPKAAEKTASPGVTAPAERIPTDIRRLTIIVRDMDKSLAFYRDVLGLKVNYDIITTTSGVALPAGEPGAKARLILLNSNDPWVGWIGLMQWVDPAIPADPYPTRMKPGGAVLVVNTDDAAKRCALAKALPAIKMTSEARLQVYPGRNGGPDIRVMGCNVFDPDGILVEINQLLKD